MEAFYVTGYTNLLNDTLRNMQILATASNSKQPLYYEPNGIVFGDQAFNFTPGTGIMASLFNGSITPIFYQTTANSTMLAEAGNGDNQTPIAGGVQFAGHNRTMFGQTPEPMARAGYRWLGVNLGYDTTKWDFVPIWKSGDLTEKNIGNPLSICRISDGTRSCRWDNIFAVNLDVTTLKLNGNPLAAVAQSGSYNDLSNQPAIPAPGGTTPNMDGTGTAGSSANYARADHTHPSDTSRVPTTTTVNGHPLSSSLVVTNDDPVAAHLVTGTLTGSSGAISGNGSYQTVFSVTLPSGTFAASKGVVCSARWTHSTGTAAVSFQWKLGSSAYGAQSITSGVSSTNIGVLTVEIFTPASTSSQSAMVLPLQQGGATWISAGICSGFAHNAALRCASMPGPFAGAGEREHRACGSGSQCIAASRSSPKPGPQGTEKTLHVACNPCVQDLGWDS